jgi:catechol 2,3-dioxygenase-like lactoylglutathione lyase family enzyme
VLGSDHVFVAVRDMDAAEGFCDRGMPILGFRCGSGSISEAPHVFYHGRQLAYALRPAREGAADHDSYAPGLHHLCSRVVDEEAVDRAARELRESHVEITEPRYYPEYGQEDHYDATFFGDPDWIRLEMMNSRELRRKFMYDWQASADM